MATVKFNVVFLFSLNASFLLLLQSTPAAMALNKTGFTFNLIPRYSIHSPLYPGNLTVVERIRRSVQFSESRLLSIQSSISTPKQGTRIRPLVEHFGSAFAVRLRIGSNATMAAVFLLLDTGSDVTWTQIKPCNPCFPQDEPIYRPHLSQTYSPISEGHHLCSNFQNGQCTYSIRYADDRFTKGILASDRFSIDSTWGGIETLTLVFGCSNSSSDNIFPGTRIGGVFGMSRGPESIVSQLVPFTGRKQFAYCLVDVLSTEFSYLRFGRDIVLKRKVQSTPFFKRTNIYSSKKMYYVTLLDISVDGRRLNLPGGTFDLHEDGKGGCMIDSGSSISYLTWTAYNKVKLALKNYFHRFRLKRVSGSDIDLDFCYRWMSNFTEFPTIDLHFEGKATFRLAGTNLFFIDRDDQRFCLYMLPAEEISIIGAIQQQNHQMVFDIDKEKLSFAAANCDRR